MESTHTAGYSGTPLAKKLGIKPGGIMLLVGAPEGYAALLEPLSDGVQFGTRLTASTDIVQVFTTRKEALREFLLKYRPKLKPTAAIWASWPKAASKLPTDISGNAVREVALPLGYVDIKVCAVDETWSALKLVIRKELR